jgi:S-adenosylmethionine-diacylgycerolhomoserine-N-methlytransferase
LTSSSGRFSIVDFGFCEGLGSIPRTILHGWLKLFHATPRAELEDELKALAQTREYRFRFERPFGGCTIRDGRVVVSQPLALPD